VERAFNEAETALGPVLCLVNNAGVRADNLALSLEDDEWNRVIDTNLTAAFRLTRRAMKGMLRAKYGRILSAVGDAVDLRPDRVLDVIGELGNTSAASVPLALAQASRDGRLQPGMQVLLAAVGAGFTWGATVVEWGTA
jgi:hypothetical protein